MKFFIYYLSDEIDRCDDKEECIEIQVLRSWAIKLIIELNESTDQENKDKQKDQKIIPEKLNQDLSNTKWKKIRRLFDTQKIYKQFVFELYKYSNELEEYYKAELKSVNKTDDEKIKLNLVIENIHYITDNLDIMNCEFLKKLSNITKKINDAIIEKESKRVFSTDEKYYIISMYYNNISKYDKLLLLIACIIKQKKVLSEICEKELEEINKEIDAGKFNRDELIEVNYLCQYYYYKIDPKNRLLKNKEVFEKIIDILNKTSN